MLQYYPNTRKEAVAVLKQILPPKLDHMHAYEDKVKLVQGLFLEKYILGYIISNIDVDLEVVNVCSTLDYMQMQRAMLTSMDFFWNKSL